MCSMHDCRVVCWINNMNWADYMQHGLYALFVIGVLYARQRKGGRRRKEERHCVRFDAPTPSPHPHNTHTSKNTGMQHSLVHLRDMIRWGPSSIIPIILGHHLGGMAPHTCFQAFHTWKRSALMLYTLSGWPRKENSSTNEKSLHAPPIRYTCKVQCGDVRAQDHQPCNTHLVPTTIEDRKKRSGR